MIRKIRNKVKAYFALVLAIATTLAISGVREWRKALADQRGQTSTIMAIVTGAITVLLGIIIFANIKNAMPPVNDSAANETMSTVGTIFYSATNLVVIGFIVLAAVFILAVVNRLRA